MNKHLDISSNAPFLTQTPEGLALVQNDLTLMVDFCDMLERIKPHKLSQELLVKAAKIKQKPTASATASRPCAIDATAGLGQDSFLLAAAGFQVYLFEKDAVIAALLHDALQRARADAKLSAIAARMHLIEADSIEVLWELAIALNASCNSTPTPYSLPKPDVVYLDPMFPKRTKSAAVKKKFQLLHQLEEPCENEEELLAAAMAIKPRKVVVKRMAKGPFLAEKSPDYSLKGKSVRYDCYVFA